MQRRPKRVPWIGNPRVAQQNAKRWRLVRSQKAPTKNELAAMAAKAVETHRIRRIPAGVQALRPK